MHDLHAFEEIITNKRPYAHDLKAQGDDICSGTILHAQSIGIIRLL